MQALIVTHTTIAKRCKIWYAPFSTINQDFYFCLSERVYMTVRVYEYVCGMPFY